MVSFQPYFLRKRPAGAPPWSGEQAPVTGAGVLEINCSIIESDFELITHRPGQHNLVADPQVFDAANGDYRIPDTSPTVDRCASGPSDAVDEQSRPRDL